MKINSHIFARLMFVVCLSLIFAQVAEAKRFGSGQSFGSRPSYSAPYQRSTAPASSPASQPIRSPAQQQAAAQNQAARQGLASRGGLMGMLGGLALGGLLGAMFFGGAFEGINMMDLLLFAGLGYLLYRFFIAKAGQPQTAANGYQRQSQEPINLGQQAAGNNAAGFDTDVLFKKAGGASAASSAAMPVGFNQADFMRGAENAFRHLQAAWDSGDLAEIRGLTTDKVFAEIQSQYRVSGSANKTEVLKLGSELLEVREVDNQLEAVVLFDSLMREDDGEIEQVREVWHFIKPRTSSQPKWFLDGIQQLAD